ncbi:MAG TPA: type II secretion system F family protein [archaeon]|nr:type II secretion system F family protein [archaeon]
MVVKESRFALLTKYKRIIREAQFRYKATTWILISASFSSLAFIVCYLLISRLELPISQITSFAAFLGVLDIMLGYPYLKAMERISQIEEALPEALKQMSDTLKAGGTYEFALREVALSQYGPLSKEIEMVLRKLEEGENLEDSLRSFSENINSRLISRSVTVIVDTIKAGAGLADVLDDISNDVREAYRISVERKAQVMMQVIFMVAAGVFITPMIFGFVSTVISLFIRAGASAGVSEAQRLEVLSVKDFILTLMLAYLLIEVLATSTMVALMRDGKLSKSIIYFPILLLLAFILYYVAGFASGLMIG